MILIAISQKFRLLSVYVILTLYVNDEITAIGNFSSEYPAFPFGYMDHKITAGKFDGQYMNTIQ